MATTTTRSTAVLAALTFGLALGACGDDPAPTADPATTAAGGGSDEPVVVTAVDYAFEGVPATVEAGTRLTIVNESEAELHELVAFRLPDGETRSAEELLALPEEESEAILGGGPPAAVLIAPPGGADVIEAVGDGTLTDPGRYLLLCAIPVGADPQAYLEAAEQATDGPPEVEGGPPHFTRGMIAELTVG